MNTEDCNESGRVYLELADATPAEAARGMALLETALWGDHSAAWGSSG